MTNVYSVSSGGRGTFNTAHFSDFSEAKKYARRKMEEATQFARSRRLAEPVDQLESAMNELAPLWAMPPGQDLISWEVMMLDVPYVVRIFFGSLPDGAVMAGMKSKKITRKGASRGRR